MKRLYAEIAKTEAQEDGTIKVFGYASSGAEDSDGETITSDAMKAALPDYMKFGAVREMHDAKKAAGTAIEAEVQEDGRTWFGAHVVDPVAVKKVETGVYKGFSIGGKVTERDSLNKRLIKGVKLVEVSLVDRPANPEAVFTMFKAETDHEDEPESKASVEILADMLNKGDVTPGRLLELAKSEDDFQKGMWNATRLLEALSLVKTACEDAEFEAKRGEHSDAIIASMKSLVGTLAATLKDYISEEVGSPSASDMALAAQTGDLAKAGARYSKTTKAALGDLHKMVKACDAHLGKMGYDEAEDESEETEGEPAKDDPAKTAQADDLQKACTVAGCPEGTTASDWLAGISAELESMRTIAKAAGVEGDSPAGLVNALVKRAKEAEAEIAKLKDQPAPPKGYANGVALSKADDSSGGEAKEVAPVITSSGEENEVATLIKAAQANPIRLA